MFRRFLGLPESRTTAPQHGAATSRPTTPESESGSVRRLVARLEMLPPEHARFLACYAYTLARAAEADMSISAAETALMEQLVAEDGGLSHEQASLVVQLAEAQASTVGGTDDFLVTREFLAVSTPDQRRALVRACLAVSAADGSITADESSVADQIANELELDSSEMSVIRREFHDRMSAIQALRRRLAPEAG